MKINAFILILVALLLISCQQSDVKESPTKGCLVISVSESVAPTTKKLAAKFMNIYNDAKVSVNYVSAREAIVHLLNDSVEAIIVSRSLNQEEQAVAEKAGLNLRSIEIAFGGFVAIVNKSNPIKGMRVSQLDSIFKGFTSSWKQLGWHKSTSSIKFFIPERNSDVHEWMITKFSTNQNLPAYFISLNSTDSVIQAVSNFANAIGVVGLDYYDTLYTGIKFLELSNNSKQSDSLGVSGLYFSPAQAYVYRKHYPLWAPVYMITNIKSVGLASGFVSFVSSVQGQQIVLNNGLVPATMPVRIIHLNRGE